MDRYTDVVTRLLRAGIDALVARFIAATTAPPTVLDLALNPAPRGEAPPLEPGVAAVSADRVLRA